MLATRLVIRRAAVSLLAHASPGFRQPRYKYVRTQFAITTFKPTSWVRTYATQPGQDKENQNQNQHQQGPKTENNEKEEKEGKDEEGKEEVEKDEKDAEGKEKKEDDTPIEEPGWKTARAGTFKTQKQGKQGPQEIKISRELAILYWLLGLGGFSITFYTLFQTFSQQYKDGQADLSSLFRKVLEESIHDIVANQKVIDAFFKTPSVVEEGMANCQVFGNVTTLSYPLLQINTAARLGTVYIDLCREEDIYEIRSAYVDSVYGRTLDLMEAGIVKPSQYDVFAPEFSVQRTMELMQQAHEELQRQQAVAAAEQAIKAQQTAQRK